MFLVTRLVIAERRLAKVTQWGPLLCSVSTKAGYRRMLQLYCTICVQRKKKDINHWRYCILAQRVSVSHTGSKTCFYSPSHLLSTTVCKWDKQVRHMIVKSRLFFFLSYQSPYKVLKGWPYSAPSNQCTLVWRAQGVKEEVYRTLFHACYSDPIDKCGSSSNHDYITWLHYCYGNAEFTWKVAAE